ncbi:M20/M25/M40 family metallo-hydrolase [Longimicrobium sp.]|uniref:M20/M25/M40 family metallo-hydrolase n=1 Tax=Longimicrobium sp. TaxID=2029185 RepID=UPI002B65F014|nr:M20/M25/M40 family metallo-hydrolase [Longimicrobium sp.]HSU16240.1 M20/M25/M40 family metallo-hydrolase [Longimicrobium sp.]
MTRGPSAFLPAALAMFAGAASLRAQSAAPLPPEVAAAANTITITDARARLEFISSDLMRGRDTPSPELNIVASYLASNYQAMGFQPGGEGTTFFQWYPYGMRRLDPTAARLQVTGGAAPVAFTAGRDFWTAGGTAQDVSGSLVYIGRAPDALTAPGSLTGRIAVAAIPGGPTRDWRLERNRIRTAARRAGAVAVAYVLGPEWTADSVAKYAATAARPTRSVGTEPAYPQFFLSQEAAGRLFRAANLDLAQQWTAGAGNNFHAVPLASLTATGALPMEQVDQARAPNVIAIWPGSDPVLKNEYVVLSAHMDHVGVGQAVNGDSIYNGADDDGSGTTGILEVARAFQSMGLRPKRSIVILHVSGEEKGLLGSEWFSEHPTLPLAQIVADINIDMIGRNNPDSVVVIGKNYSTLGATVNAVQRAHGDLHLTLADDIWPQERFFFRSDHFNFARKEIPAIFFFSGVHADYHRPSDEVSKIDFDKLTRIARMAFFTAWEVANAPQRPQWDPRGLAEVRGMTR